MSRLAQLKDLLGPDFYDVTLTPDYRPGGGRKMADIVGYCAGFRERGRSNATLFIRSGRYGKVFPSEQAAWADMLEDLRKATGLWPKTALAKDLAASTQRAGQK